MGMLMLTKSPRFHGPKNIDRVCTVTDLFLTPLFTMRYPYNIIKSFPICIKVPQGTFNSIFIIIHLIKRVGLRGWQTKHIYIVLTLKLSIISYHQLV